MTVRPHIAKRRSSWILLAVFISPFNAMAVEIPGKVVQVEDRTVTVALNSQYLPKPGDQVEIYFKIPGLDEDARVADGAVSRVDDRSVEVTVSRTLGRIAKGQLARITSNAPQKSRDKSATKEKGDDQQSSTARAGRPASGKALSGGQRGDDERSPVTKSARTARQRSASRGGANEPGSITIESVGRGDPDVQILIGSIGEWFVLGRELEDVRTRILEAADARFGEDSDDGLEAALEKQGQAIDALVSNMIGSEQASSGIVISGLDASFSHAKESRPEPAKGEDPKQVRDQLLKLKQASLKVLKGVEEGKYESRSAVRRGVEQAWPGQGSAKTEPSE